MESAKITVPTNFYCPITGDLMEDPVTDKEGNSYEREQIMEWLKIKKNSPVTRNYLDETHLSENPALKRSIESVKEQLQEDQLHINTQLSEVELKPFTDTLGGIELKSYYLDDKLFVNIHTPDMEVRPPVDIVLCIDVSYSMFDPATLKGDSNETITHGFSVLSLTVAAAKTILHSLNENDNLSIVTYSSEAKTIFENMSCTPENKLIIEEGLNALKPISNTNMWQGLHQSLDILRTTSPPNKVKGILLLTDGIPNVDPPRGHGYMLEKYFKDFNFKCGISCYGFGYNLNSVLLSELSTISGGDGYSFIPDASCLASVFINGISNLLTTAVQHPQLTITLTKGVTFSNSIKGLKIDLDSLKYGQDKNLMFDLDTRYASSRSHDYLNDFANIELTFGSTTLVTNENVRPERDYYINHRYRIEAAQLIDNCIDKKKYNDTTFIAELNKFIGYLKKEQTNEYVQNILFDLNGQVKEALNMTSQGEREDWFTRWGNHYLRSLRGAYQHEICNNFKDKGVSNFGGTLFHNLIDEISTIFDSQPPPKKDIPQRAPPVYSSGRVRGSGAIRGANPSASPSASPTRSRPRVVENAAPVDMRMYNTASGGCCAEGSRVYMNDGTYKAVEDIQKGDEVVTFETFKDEKEQYHETYSVSKIECVVKTKCTNGQVTMVQVNNLMITPYHPIIDLVNKEKHWIFPISKGSPVNVFCPYMYSFVTENRKSLIVERHVFATYGHHCIDQEVIQHDYFGTEKIINDLKKIPTYDFGLVQLEQGNFTRDYETKRVNGLII